MESSFTEAQATQAMYFSDWVNWESPVASTQPVLDLEDFWYSDYLGASSSLESLDWESLHTPMCAGSSIVTLGTIEGSTLDLASALLVPSATSPFISASTPQLTPDTGSLDLPSSPLPIYPATYNVPSWVHDYEQELSVPSDSEPSSSQFSSPENSASDFSTSSPLSSVFSEGSGEGESSSGSEYTPSEYASSPRLPLLTQRSSYKSARASSSRNPSKSPRKPSSRTNSSRGAKRAPSSFAKQCQPIKTKSRRTATRSVQVPLSDKYPEPVNYACPICPHRQRNERMPDLRRHIDAHYSAARKDWICCGVPLAEARGYGLDDFSDARVWPETGKMMVGGCGKIFTRKDAYKRHLYACKETSCAGDVNGNWVPGNVREGRC